MPHINLRGWCEALSPRVLQRLARVSRRNDSTSVLEILVIIAITRLVNLIIIIIKSCRAASTDISLVLSCHFSQSFIASGRSSGLYPVSSQTAVCMFELVVLLFPRPYVGVHRSTWLMSTSLLLQHVWFVLTWIVFVVEVRWPYSGASCGVASRTCLILLKHSCVTAV